MLIVPDAELETVGVPDVDGEDVPDTDADGLIEGLGLDVVLIVPDAVLETVCVPDVDGEDVPDTDAEADAEEEVVGVCPAVCSNKSKRDKHTVLNISSLYSTVIEC